MATPERAPSEAEMTVPETISLRQLERKAYRSFFNDGIYDIWFGVLASAMASYWLLKGLSGGSLLSRAVGYGLLALSILVAVGGKKLITVPRIGAVRFGPARQRSRSTVTAVVGLVVIASFALLAIASARGIPSAGVPAVPLGDLVIAALVAVVFCVIARFLQWRRLYAYGPLLAIAVALAPALGQHTQIPPAAPFIPPVAIPLLVGAVILVRFLRQYPAAAPGAGPAQ